MLRFHHDVKDIFIYFRDQFWEPIPIPSLVSEALLSHLQLPLTVETVHSSSAHYHWQLVLLLPLNTGESMSYTQWMRSMVSVAPPSVTTSKSPVELLSLSNDQQIQAIVKVGCQKFQCFVFNGVNFISQLFQGFSPSQSQEKCASCLKGTSAILTYIPNTTKLSHLQFKCTILIIVLVSLNDWFIR